MKWSKETQAVGPPTKPVLSHRRTNPLPLVASFVKKFTMFRVSNTEYRNGGATVPVLFAGLVALSFFCKMI